MIRARSAPATAPAAPLRLGAAALLALCAACTAPDLPGVDDRAAAAAAWPRIEPLSPLLAAGMSPTLTPEEVAATAAQGAATQARADALQARPPAP